MKTISLISLMIVPLLIFVVCGEKQPEQTPAAQAPFEADSLLPTSAGGYSLASRTAKQTPEEVKSFVGDDLAAKMEQYSVVGLAAGIYKGGNFALTVQIVQFLQPLDAFGYYSIDRPDGVDTTSLGTEGYLSDHTFRFTQSSYAVSISSADLGDSTLQNVLPVAITISAAIGSAPPLPEQFGLFPEKYEVVPSNRYYAGPFLNINDVTGVFTVDYLISGDSLRLFLSDDGYGTKFAALVKASGQTMETSPVPADFAFDEGYGVLVDYEPYGMILAGLKEGRLIGAVGYNPEKDADFVSEWVRGFTGPSDEK